MVFSFLFGKNTDYPTEYKRFKKAMDAHPLDQGLKAQFIKFCLLNRFTKNEGEEKHIVEALGLFDKVSHAEDFDLQCHYLVGKYYQEVRNIRKAYQVYREAVKHFNLYVEKHPDHKSDNAELVYSISLNMMALQADPHDLDLKKCFKLIHKSYPLHLKRFELEGEMAKPAPDTLRIKQLTEEMRKLKVEAEKEVPAVPKVSAPVEISTASPAAAAAAPVKDDIFSKLFRVPSLDLAGLKKEGPKGADQEDEKDEFLKLSPVSEFSNSYMVFKNNDWEGPFTVPQLRAAGFLDPDLWVCRVGSQIVSQAHEVSELHSVIKQKA